MHRTLALVAASVVAARGACAQCEDRWIQGPDHAVRGVAGGDGEWPLVTAAVEWDPDGPGPLGPRLVVGGSFALAGDGGAANVAVWDGVRWGPLGPGFRSASSGIPTVDALLAMPNGDLVAAGCFEQSDAGEPLHRIARWDGRAWRAMGAGFSDRITDLESIGEVRALTSLPSGDIVAAGGFKWSGAVRMNGIARWDGAAWRPVGPGFDGLVLALATMPGGDVVASGDFTRAGGQPARALARWDGSAWSEAGGGVLGRPRALAAMPNGDLLVAGISQGGSTPINRVGRWDGAAWSSLGALNLGGSTIFTMAARSDGTVVIGGDLDVSGGVPRHAFGLYDGTTWTMDPAGDLLGDSPTVRAVCPMSDGSLITGGRFLTAGPDAASSVAQMSGTTWSGLGSGAWTDQQHFWCLVPDGEASLLVGGNFMGHDRSFFDSLATWDGADFTPLGTQGPSRSFAVAAAARLTDGSVAIAGSFGSIGSVPARGIARWDGTRWAGLGTGLSFSTTPVVSMAALPDGGLAVGGNFSSADNIGPFVAQWSGTAWRPMGRLNAPVRTLRRLPDGSVIAGGDFTIADALPAARVARWNGASWAAMGEGFDAAVQTSTTTPDGTLVVGGAFTHSGPLDIRGVAAWTGAGWAAVGGGLEGVVRFLAPRPNGELLAVTRTTAPDGSITDGAWRFAGGAWSLLVSAPGPSIGAVGAAGDHEIVLGSDSPAGGGCTRFGLARWSGTGTPWFARTPRPRRVAAGDTVELTAAVATGYDFDGPVSYRWTRDGVEIHDGPGGASAGGGVVAGATGVIARAEATLTIAGFTPGDAGRYECTAWNGCGQAVGGAEVLVPACDADFDGDGVLDFFDYDAMVACFEIGACPPAADADFNHDGFADFFDYADFVAAFEAGC